MTEEELQQQEKETPHDDRITFASAYYRYLQDTGREKFQLRDYGKFLSDQLKEAKEKRAEEAEDTNFISDLIGYGLAATTFLFTGSPTAATVAYSVGSGGTRLLSGGDAHTYGLTTAEMEYGVTPKFYGQQFEDLRLAAVEYQADLDEYDDNAWKRDLTEVVSGTLTTFQLASKGSQMGYNPDPIRSTLGMDPINVSTVIDQPLENV